MSFALSTNPNITVCGRSTISKTSTEVFTLFYDDENSHHLTGCKNIGGVFSFYDYEAPVTGGITYKGTIDASTNPNFPAAIVGDMYIVSVAGTICGIPVNAGDMIISTAVQAAGCVPANWTIIEANAVNWQLDGNPVTSEKFIGTTTAFNFPIRTNNVQRATYTSAGFYGFGTNTPLVNYDIRGEAQVWKNTTVINPVVDLSDKSFSVEYTAALDVKSYLVGSGGSINYQGQVGNKTGNVFGVFGLVYYNQIGVTNIDGITATEPALTGAGAKVWIQNVAGTISFTAGHASYYANLDAAGGTVTEAVGYWAGWDDIANIGTTTRYTAYYGQDLTGIAGIPAVGSRWGVKILDPVQNHFAGSLGIGTGSVNPLNTLHVIGTLRFVTGNQGAGKVLVSDAAGVADWVTGVSGTGQVYTPSNVTIDRSYDANATTLDEIADVLGTLIGDLQTSGIIS